MGTPLTGTSNAGGVGRNRDSEPISGFSAGCLRRNMPGVVNRVAGGPLLPFHRLASYDTSLAVSSGVDCGGRQRNVYDKKPQRYAKDNRIAHLT